MNTKKKINLTLSKKIAGAIENDVKNLNFIAGAIENDVSILESFIEMLEDIGTINEIHPSKTIVQDFKEMCLIYKRRQKDFISKSIKLLKIELKGI